MSDTNNRPAARELLVEGAKAFRLGDFDKAIESFKKSYDLYPDPIALYNIAQVYRQQKNHDKALFFYRQYLSEAPNAPDKARIQQRITELQDIIAAQKAVADRPPDGVQPTAGAQPVRGQPAITQSMQDTQLTGPPAASDASTRHPLYQWVLAGGGLTVAAVGLGIIFSANGLDSDASKAGTATEARDLREQAVSRRNVGIGVTVSGGVLAAAGAALLLWPRERPDDRSAHLQKTSALVGPGWIGIRGTF